MLTNTTLRLSSNSLPHWKAYPTAAVILTGGRPCWQPEADGRVVVERDPEAGDVRTTRHVEGVCRAPAVGLGQGTRRAEHVVGLARQGAGQHPPHRVQGGSFLSGNVSSETGNQ